MSGSCWSSISNLLNLVQLQTIFAILVLLMSNHCLIVSACTHLEVEVCTANSKVCHCIPCQTCPAGEGLEPECGSQVILKIPQCIKCHPGKTYSQENNTQSCQPCPICHGQKILQACNGTHPSVCSDDCDEGFEFNEVVGMCEHKNDEDLNKKTVNETNITLHKRNTNTSLTVDKHPNSSSSKPRPKQPSNPFKNSNKTISIYIFCALGLAIGCAVTWVLYKNWDTVKKKLRGVPWYKEKTKIGDEEMPLHAFISDSILLNSISPDLRRKIATAINKKCRGVRNWQDIGYEYGIEKIYLDEIAEANFSDTTSPGESLLDKISAIKPEESLNGFIAELHKLQRKDVIKLIKEDAEKCYQNGIYD